MATQFTQYTPASGNSRQLWTPYDEDKDEFFWISAELRTWEINLRGYDIEVEGDKLSEGVIEIEDCPTIKLVTPAGNYSVVTFWPNGVFLGHTRAKQYKQALTNLRFLIEH